jgi:hypothetical protein
MGNIQTIKKYTVNHYNWWCGIIRPSDLYFKLMFTCIVHQQTLPYDTVPCPLLMLTNGKYLCYPTLASYEAMTCYIVEIIKQIKYKQAER